jgi:hypothetical protein
MLLACGSRPDTRNKSAGDGSVFRFEAQRSSSPMLHMSIEPFGFRADDTAPGRY